MERDNYDVIVIGSGPGGLTAGMYASRAGLKTVCLDRMGAGGQMLMTEVIENYPGFIEPLSGFDLAEKMAGQAKKWGVELAYGDVKSFSERGADGIITVATDSGEVKCRALIIATGAQPRGLGIPGEEAFRGRGVSYCAVCDGNFYRGKTVCVIGGGDSAVEEAAYLSNICEKVHIVHRRDEFRASKISQDAAAARPNISYERSCIPVEILGSDFVTALRIKELKTDVVREVPCDGVFLYVGINPITEFVKGKLNLSEQGFIVTDERMRTSMEGVYAVGDVRRARARQVATAVGDGAEAAISVQQYLQEYPW